MRKVALGMQVSLDGFVATDDGGLDWAFAHFEPKLLGAIEERLSQLDVVLMGRHNYEEQAATWPHMRDDPIAEIMNSVQKIVFSRTLETLEWENARLADGTPEEVVARLKNEEGGDIGVSGGATLAGRLAAAGLIDEYRLAVHPVALGKGMRLFTAPIELELVDSVRFDSGITLNTYRPAVTEPAHA